MHLPCWHVIVVRENLDIALFCSIQVSERWKLAYIFTWSVWWEKYSSIECSLQVRLYNVNFIYNVSANHFRSLLSLVILLKLLFHSIRSWESTRSSTTTSFPWEWHCLKSVFLLWNSYETFGKLEAKLWSKISKNFQVIKTSISLPSIEILDDSPSSSSIQSEEEK